MYEKLRGAVSSRNLMVDRFLRADADTKFHMLTTGSFSELVDFLREQELIEYVLLYEENRDNEDLLASYMNSI